MVGQNASFNYPFSFQCFNSFFPTSSFVHGQLSCILRKKIFKSCGFCKEKPIHSGTDHFGQVPCIRSRLICLNVFTEDCLVVDPLGCVLGIVCRGSCGSLHTSLCSRTAVRSHRNVNYSEKGFGFSHHLILSTHNGVCYGSQCALNTFLNGRMWEVWYNQNQIEWL